MEKKIAGLLGAVAALSTLNAAQAAPALAPAPLDVLHANGYADLLEPIPNAVALLKQVDDQTPAPSAKAGMQVAQAHHHHHHHHVYSRRPVIVIPRHRHHHHHHHHHHHYR
ncbi:MAG TPA: hypothetical protein VKR55_24260 [Bradyrhizobium sp.]|uniref:hypothetical protein n=1 Tax=Bradyrhizobium sp. TaxID=376 RepID=UPI002B6BFAED|nr:hypothetical protein [Bradyrhizobium sp.]HLZ05249.1 hypothetical protein [Bradyrhizobium sp.]